MKDDYLIIVSIFVLMLFCNLKPVLGQSNSTANKNLNNNCTTALTWSIGEIDSRFEIKADTIKRIMEEVNQLWSRPVGNKLLMYSDSAQFKINFIYSDGQEFTNSEQELTQKINKMRLDYYAMKIDYQQLSNQYNTLSSNYNDIISKYDELVKDYKRTLSRWDDSGVIPREENEKLNNLKKKIEQKKLTSEKRLDELNTLAKKMEQLSTKLNNQADRVNESIFYYRENFTQMKTFHQGSYLQTGGRRKINIYQFEDLNKLRLVLAHEVGHALGLSHVYNAESIMYFLMENQKVRNLQLSDEDIQAIKDRCFN